jgi:hypothetical protein
MQCDKKGRMLGGIGVNCFATAVVSVTRYCPLYMDRLFKSGVRNHESLLFQ